MTKLKNMMLNNFFRKRKNLNALTDGKEEISWEEFETEQYSFLSESHITVRIAHLRPYVAHAFLFIPSNFSFIQAKMSQENLDAYKDLVERYMMAIS